MLLLIAKLLIFFNSYRLSVARDAEKIAKEASEKAGIIKEKADESRDSASELASATQSLTEKLTDTKSRLEQKEGIAKTDGNSAKEALEKANKAQTKAHEASEKVEKAKKELEDISAILSTVQEPGKTKLEFEIAVFIKSYCAPSILSEPGLLDELRRRVEVAEQNFKAAELDNRLEEFKAAKKLQVCCQKIKLILNI